MVQKTTSKNPCSPTAHLKLRLFQDTHTPQHQNTISCILGCFNFRKINHM